MDNAKKMILIEPEVIEKLKKDNNSKTNVNNLSQLDEEMHKVLRNTKLDDREKWSLYLQTLQRYLYFVGKDRKPLEIPIISLDEPGNIIKENGKSDTTADSQQTSSKVTEEKPDCKDFYSKSQLLQFIPKSYQLKGELLIQFLSKNKDKIFWNDKGTIFIDNKEVYKSNIVDLLGDILRPLKNSSPNGWVQFSTALKDLQVPISYIGNPKRATFINISSKSPASHERFENKEPYSPEYSTPRTSATTTGDPVKRKINWQKWTPY